MAYLYALLYCALFILHAAASSFLSPKTGPKWRYWVQDAGVSPEVVAFDVEQMAQAGASGIELIDFQSSGGAPVLDPSDFGFGSTALTNITSVFVQAARENDVTVDLTLGPNQGAGIPIAPELVDTPGMNTELVFGKQFLLPGQAFNGQIPDPVIVPVITFDGIETAIGNITKKELVAVVTADVLPGANLTAPRVSLDWNSVRDVTHLVRSTGNTSTIDLPSISNNSTSVLLAFYSRRNGYPESKPGFNGPQPGKPGSWGTFVVDHFSALGAQRSFDVISQLVLDCDDIGDILKVPAVGKYGWEDSMEFRAQVYWTNGFPTRFKERHGYNVSAVLPAFFANPRPPFGGVNLPPQTFDFGNTVQWTKFIDDYTDTLTSLYVDYMNEWNKLLTSRGLQFSNQPAYNFPLDVGASAVIPQIPETESLGVPLIDNARQIAGGVHLAGRRVFSSENGARRNEAHALRMKELLEDSKIQFASGVNLLMLHGYAYSGNYPNTSWPGFTTFVYQYAEMHGPAQPGWTHYPQYLRFLARNQYFLQSGVARRDVAIYHHSYDLTFTSVFESAALQEAGYTYDYISPEALRIVDPKVENGTLGVPRYKAIILNRAQNITLEAAQRLVRYAQDGLAIIVLGDAPSDVHGFDPKGKAQGRIQSLMNALTKIGSVKHVQSEADVPIALRALDRRPTVSFEPSSPQLYSVHRDNGTSNHIYIFNLGDNEVKTDVFVDQSVIGHPFVLDAWTGSVSPAAIWHQNRNGTIIPDIVLAANQTMLITMTTATNLERNSQQSVHLTSLTGNATAIALDQRRTDIRAETEESFSYTTSDGRNATAKMSLRGAVPTELDPWNLTIAKWTPPQNLNEVRSVIVNESIALPNGLQPWLELPGLQNISGVGFYSTSFEWQHAGDLSVGARLDFGTVFHTIEVRVNGKKTEPVDLVRPVVDISALLENGTNDVQVEVASTLLNAVTGVGNVFTLGVSRPDAFRMKGRIPPSRQGYGLLSPVRLVPFGRLTLNMS